MRENKRHLYVDISRNGSKSIAGCLEPLISKMESMTMLDIKSAFNTILDDTETLASQEIRNKWRADCKNNLSKSKMMFMLTNLYLAGAKLKI